MSETWLTEHTDTWVIPRLHSLLGVTKKRERIQAAMRQLAADVPFPERHGTDYYARYNVLHEKAEKLKIFDSHSYPFTTGLTYRPMNGTPNEHIGKITSVLKSFGCEEIMNDVRDYSIYDWIKTDTISYIKASLKTLRTWEDKGWHIYFPGRDVWVWYVLAMRYGMKDVSYDQRISRNTIGYTDLMQKCLMSDPLRINAKKILVFDTGFAGSIWRKLSPILRSLGKENKCIMLSCDAGAFDVKGTQIFPCLTGSRGAALEIEGAPKYEHSARAQSNGFNPYIQQTLVDVHEFLKAYILTTQLWYNTEPNFITSKKFQSMLNKRAEKKQARLLQLKLKKGADINSDLQRYLSVLKYKNIDTPY